MKFFKKLNGYANIDRNIFFHLRKTVEPENNLRKIVEQEDNLVKSFLYGMCDVKI